MADIEIVVVGISETLVLCQDCPMHALCEINSRGHLSVTVIRLLV